MAIIYNVNVEPAGKENQFRITWHNMQTGKMDYFEISPAAYFVRDMKNFPQIPGQQSDIGRKFQFDIGQKLFYFLDGDARHLELALNDAKSAGELLQLHLFTCRQVANWPFELLAQEDSFLLTNRLHLVRRVSDWGAAKEIHPVDRQLKMLFMACSAVDIKPELDFEREEEAIFKATEKLAVNMEVEDSGSLEGLKDKLTNETYDVIHISCHSDIDENDHPYLIMENETGHHILVSPNDLWRQVLSQNPPHLLFLSGCRTGKKPGNEAAMSFAQIMVERYHIPAVLGWGGSIDEEQAICTSKALYHELSRGKSILHAIHQTRYQLITEFANEGNPAWHLLRLFSTGQPLNALVTEGQKPIPKPGDRIYAYLRIKEVKVLKEGFVGRRRQLQQSLNALKNDGSKVGVLLLGTGGLGKSCLAGKLNERLKNDDNLIVVHGKLETGSLAAALKDAFLLAQDEKAKQILDMPIKMTEKLENLCTGIFKNKNYLLLLDDFEQNLEGSEKGNPGFLLPEPAELLKTLLHYLPFSGKMSKLIITSRYDFSLTEMGRDLAAENLEKVWLTSFNEVEQQKKKRTLKHILNYKSSPQIKLLNAAFGNPALMDDLDQLTGKIGLAEVEQLQEAIKIQCENFIKEHLLREILQNSGHELEALLTMLSIYRRPVLKEGIQAMAEKAGLLEWEQLTAKGMSLSLIEYHHIHKAYGVLPLFLGKLQAKREDILFYHEIAYGYYKKICTAKDTIEPVVMEEWIYHALGCGQGKIVSEQGARLVWYLRESFAFREAQRVSEWILAEKSKDFTNEEDAILLNEIALTFKTMCHYDKAVELYQKALGIDRALFGKTHFTVARDLNNLGVVIRMQLGPAEALKYFEQALRIVESEGFACQNLEMAGNIFNNMGSIRHGMLDYDKAEELYHKALRSWESVYDKRHPNIATLYNNLGAICSRLNKYEEAANYFNLALSIDQSIYGKMHFEVATDLNNLGMVFAGTGDHNQAIDYYEQALTIWQHVYGSCHPNFAVTLNNMADAYLALNQKEKASVYFKNVYPIFKEKFGPNHTHTIDIYNKIKMIAAGS